jgi:hypothetical protein
MNILDAEDMIKGLPDQALMQEAQMPSGQMPQFLVVSEIQRRSDMRKRYQAQQQEAMPSVKDQIVQEGIMGAMPQQPMGMPPQGMSPGMPPMGMAQGGIARMANGGSTSMPGAGALMGAQVEYIDPLLEQAKILAQTTGRSIEEAYEALKREAQMNMPDYSMIAPAGMGQMPALPSPPAGMRPPRAVPGGIDVGAMGDIDSAVSQGLQGMYGMIPKSSPDGGMVGRGIAEMRGAIDSAGSYIDSAVDSAGNYLGNAQDYIVDDVSRSVAPIRQADIEATQRIRDVYENQGIGAGIGQFFREIPTVAGATGSAVLQDIANFPPIAGAANMLDQLVTGSTDDPLTLGQIFGSSDEDVKPAGGKEVQSVSAIQKQSIPQVGGEAFDFATSIFPSVATGDDVPVTPPMRPDVDIPEVTDDKPGTETAPPITGIVDLAADLYTDESDPKLDLSDLIGDSRRMAQANALMQLGAGIAGGDLSKGISAAGAAATKGMQDARTLEMKKRLAEYQAGREDLSREEKSRQFYDQLEVIKTRYGNELEKSARIGRNELFRTASSLVEAAMGESMLTGEQRKAMVDRLMNEYLSLYGPAFGVTDIPAMPPPSGAGDYSGFSIRR